MFSFLSNFFIKNRIECFAPLPLSACKVQKPYLLKRAGITDGTVFMLAVPYYTPFCNSALRNLSAYAVATDYHLFFEKLFAELMFQLSSYYPQHRFAGFADHSPIDEVDAAAKAGLGVIGKNGLLLTEQYSSYVFLGELITDASLPVQAHPIAVCENCGACYAACPMQHGGECRSALTQKKGALSAEEEKQLSLHPLVWGCDICQEVCPYTKRAIEKGTIYSPIPFFEQAPIATLTTQKLEELLDTEFSSRAYSWRGKETILRNLRLKG